MSLRDFVVIYDDMEYPVKGALDAQDAASMACQDIYSDSAGEAFDHHGGKPTRLTVGDEVFDVYLDFQPHFHAHPVKTP